MRFSIITPTLNRHDMLVKALDSVTRQNWPDFEHIIVDGGSNDGTLELVTRRPDLRLIGGPDDGIYDALNKGIKASSGDVIGFLNSDDYFEPGAFAAVAEALSDDPECDCVCGSAQLVAADRGIVLYDREEDKRLVTARTALLGNCVINARFFRRDAVTRIGTFSTNYRIVSDRDFLMRAVALGLKTRPIEALVYTYQRHQDSLSFSGDKTRRPAIWRELLVLARYWAEADGILPADRQIARALEGRCLGRLVQEKIAEGKLLSAWRVMAKDGRGLFRNLTALAGGLVDAAAATNASRNAMR